MTLSISNPSRGGTAPSVVGDPVGAKALDPIRLSLRDSASFVDITKLQMEIGFARSHALGIGGSFEKQLPRTVVSSVHRPVAYVGNPTVSVVPNDGLSIIKTSSSPQGSTYFTSVDRLSAMNRSAMVTSVLRPDNVPAYTPGTDPFGPTFGLFHGPRNTAVYCTFLFDGAQQQVRICGPNIGGVRSPDVFVPITWTGMQQYILFWNEVGSQIELWMDNTGGAGGIGSATLVQAIPISQFSPFPSGSPLIVGGANDITGFFGVEGLSATAATIRSIATAVDAGAPLVNGSRTGDWLTYLDSDVTMGFSGSVDPTRLSRGGAWFISPTNVDPAGKLAPSAVSPFCRLQKSTANTSYALYRDEPGFAKTATDGLMFEFEVNILTTGGSGYATGAAIQISDGQTLFQLDFLSNGSTYDVGLLKAGGSAYNPDDHLLAATPVDYRFKTLRLVVDPRRNLIDLYDTSNLAAPLATWALNRGALPVSATTKLFIGLVGNDTAAIGTFDIYRVSYTYLYQAWEGRDAIDPTAANPAYSAGEGIDTGTVGPLDDAIMIGVLPLGSTANGGAGSGSASIGMNGVEIVATGGETLIYSRNAFFDVNRGGVLEMAVQITSWHPGQRTGVVGILDDGLNAYMISFVETDTGKYVCIPLSFGGNFYQEYAGQTGPAAKLSVRIDWTQMHTYRLERRPRDGVYLYIDNNPMPALVLHDTDRYSFPTTQLLAPMVAFGQYTGEGATSVWNFVRDFFGPGYELSTELLKPSSDLRTRLSNARTTVVITAGD